MVMQFQNTRFFAAGLMLYASLQSGCQSAQSPSGNTDSIDTAKSVVEIEGAVVGLMGYIDFDGQNRAFLFGEKNFNGEVTLFSAMAVVTANGSLFQYIFDQDGRMVQLIDGDRTVDIAYDQGGATFTLSSEGMTEQYPIPDGFSEVFAAMSDGTELFASGRTIATAATRPFSVSTFVKAVALPATALGGFIAAAAATPASPILLGLAGLGALGATIKGVIDISNEASGRPLTTTELRIREVADSAVLVNDAVSFGVNANTAARFLTQAPDAPTVLEAFQAIKDAREGANTLAPTVEQGLTELERLIANASDDNTSNGGSCGSILFINSIFSDAAIRVMTTNLDAVIERNTNAPRMVVCDSLFVQVFDTGGGLIGSFTVPFSAVNVPAAETPILDITYTRSPEPSLGAFVDYLTLDGQSLATSVSP